MKQCPFCGDYNAKPSLLAMECKTCGARGPVLLCEVENEEDRKAGMLALWNERPRRLRSESVPFAIGTATAILLCLLASIIGIGLLARLARYALPF